MKKLIVMALSTVCLLVQSCTGNSARANDVKAEKPALVDATTEKNQPAEDKPAATVKTIAATVSGADILPAITKNYSGKVVLIDFWATWCPPCRAAMKTIDAIKPALQKKGCVFVYVTGETSPKADWDKMIPNIAGDHYRLTDKQWGELCKQLGIPGIPCYLLLNKDGSVAYSNVTTAGYPGNDVIQNNVEVALTK